MVHSFLPRAEYRPFFKIGVRRLEILESVRLGVLLFGGKIARRAFLWDNPC